MREAPTDRPDPALALFELGAQVAEACVDDAADPVAVLGAGIASALDADWVVVLGADGERFRHGSPPDRRWLAAFYDGSGDGTVDHVDLYVGNGYALDSSTSVGGVTLMYVGPGSWYRDHFVHGRRLLPTK